MGCGMVTCDIYVYGVGWCVLWCGSFGVYCNLNRSLSGVDLDWQIRVKSDGVQKNFVTKIRQKFFYASVIILSCDNFLACTYFCHTTFWYAGNCEWHVRDCHSIGSDQLVADWILAVTYAWLPWSWLTRICLLPDGRWHMLGVPWEWHKRRLTCRRQ